jgi:hypothetical protein
MRFVVLAALLVAGCSTGAGVAPSSVAPAASIATAAPTVDAPSTSPTEVPTPSASANTEYTADDEAIATAIRATADEAIPELKGLNKSDPSQLEDLFLPLDVWLTSQRAAVAEYTPSSCTTTAVELFTEGLDRYDDIREKFLAWRDWGANGHAFPVAAPGQAVLAFEEALAELEAHCAA